MTNTQIQKFVTVGVSTKNGDTTKFRFTNRGAETYGDILVKEGHTGVQFIDLTDAMSKADAVAAFVAQFPEFAELHTPGAKPEKVARVAKAKLTPEQVAAAKLATKRARDAAAKREKRAAVKAADAATSTADANLEAALALLREINEAVGTDTVTDTAAV